MRALSIRLDDDLGKSLDEICRETGYKKNTLVTRLIASFVKNRGKAVSETGHKTNDPFDSVIGLMEIDELISSPNEIDKIVYNL